VQSSQSRRIHKFPPLLDNPPLSALLGASSVYIHSKNVSLTSYADDYLVWSRNESE